jgi:histidinol-phosphate/aromatic aminotransferase/cobyric acid decarboxylase-like protein
MHMDACSNGEATKPGPHHVLDFTLLSNPIGPSGKAKHAMRKALREAHLPADPQTLRLRRFLARKERVEPENILLGHGSAQLLDMLMAAYKPRRLLAPSPLPAHYARLAARHATEIVPFPLRADRRFSLDGEALAAAVQGMDALFLPNPHPLTGTLAESATLDRIIDAVAGARTILVIDEALAGFAPVESPVARAVKSPNLIILRTFSLFHGLAGLRLGYAIAGLETCRRVGDTIDPGHVNIVAAAGALASLRDAGFARRTAEFLASERAYMAAKLARIEGVTPIETPCNFLLAAVGKDAAGLRQRLLERNILIDIFEEGGEAYLRVPLRRRRENAQLARALARAVAEGTGS